MYPEVVTKVNERTSMVFSGATGTYGQTILHLCLFRLLKKGSCRSSETEFWVHFGLGLEFSTWTLKGSLFSHSGQKKMWLSIIRGEQSWKTPWSHSCHRDRDIEAYRHGSLERGGSYLSYTWETWRPLGTRRDSGNHFEPSENER